MVRGIVLLLVVMAVAGCGTILPSGNSQQPLSQPPQSVSDPQYTAPAPAPGVTSAQSGSAPVVVVTATGVPDLGVLLGNQPMTPVAGARIDWDHLRMIPQWREDFGLTGKKVLYAQSSKPGQINLPLLKNQTVFLVPEETVLIFGAFSANVTLGNDKSYSFSDGFYGAVPAGTTVKVLTVKDGFLLLAHATDAQAEYCMRVAQTFNERWAHEHLYRLAAWKEPVCSGVVTTPIGDFLR